MRFRFAQTGDEALILKFVRDLAEYEKAPDRVVADEDLLRAEIFEKHHAEVLFVLQDDADSIGAEGGYGAADRRVDGVDGPGESHGVGEGGQANGGRGTDEHSAADRHFDSVDGPGDSRGAGDVEHGADDRDTSDRDTGDYGADELGPQGEVGFALFFHNFSTWLGRSGIYLEDLFVMSSYRGRGYGKALLSELARIAVERGCGRLEWSCLDWNQPSIDFYLSLGAEPMDDWTMYRLEGETLAALADSE